MPKGAKGCNPKIVQKHEKTGTVGRASIKRGLGEPVSSAGWRTSIKPPAGWADQCQAQPVGCQNLKKKTYCRSTSFLTANDSAKKTGKIFTLFDAGAVPTRRRLPGLGTVPARETPLDHRWPSKPANLVPCLEASKRSKSLKNTQKRAKKCGLKPKQAKNMQKRAKPNQRKGAIRVQLGCNQGAIRVQKGATAKSCKNKQKRAQLGACQTRGWASQYQAGTGWASQ